jgi:hypothetical protein
MRAAGRLERRQNIPHCALCGSCSTAVAAIVAAAAVSESVELQSCSAVSGGWQTGWRAGPHLLAGQEAQGSFLALAGLLSLGWVSSCCKGVGHCVLVHCGSGRRRGASCRGKGGAAQLEGRHGDAGQLRGLAALGRCGQLGGLGVAKGCGSTACGQGGGRQAGRTCVKLSHSKAWQQPSKACVDAAQHSSGNRMHAPGGRCRHASGSCRLRCLQQRGTSGERCAIGARSARHEQAGSTPRLGSHAHLLQPAVADINLNAVQQPARAGAGRGSRWRQGQGRELRTD